MANPEHLAILEQGVEAYRVTPSRIPYRSRSWSDNYINYGCSQQPVWWDDIPRLRKIINPFGTVRLSSRKSLMQQTFREEGVPCLDFTRNHDTAAQWAEDGVVVCRTLERASQGRGIVLAHSPEELVPCSLYTKLFTGHRVREYRVYIVAGKAVDITEKRRRRSEWFEERGLDRDDEYLKYIRSYKNGWVFARNTMEANEDERQLIMGVAENAAWSINLGLGAVDMIVNRYPDSGELMDIRAVETNTSLGIEPQCTSTHKLAEALVEELRNG